VELAADGIMEAAGEEVKSAGGVGGLLDSS
jgi:hypothetical protein